MKNITSSDTANKHCIIFSFFLFSAAYLATYSFPAFSEQINPGDVAPIDAPDGIINAADVHVLQRASLGLITINPVIITPVQISIDPTIATTNSNSILLTGTSAKNTNLEFFNNGLSQGTTTTDANTGMFSFNATLNTGLNEFHAIATSNTVSVEFTPVAVDNDGDGFDNTVDCNDDDFSIYPGAPEICDGIDNDCNALVDDGAPLSLYYLDNDYDGFGGSSNTIEACTSPVGYTLTGDDCDDNDATTYPGALEICNDAIDNNCDGNIDSADVSCN